MGFLLYLISTVFFSSKLSVHYPSGMIFFYDAVQLFPVGGFMLLCFFQVSDQIRIKKALEINGFLFFGMMVMADDMTNLVNNFFGSAQLEQNLPGD